MRDTEQAYRGWTLDVYEGEAGWCCDFWYSGTNDPSRPYATHRAPRRKSVIESAKQSIDVFESLRRGVAK